jgi:hypothetical protein
VDSERLKTIGGKNSIVPAMVMIGVVVRHTIPG